MKRILPLLLLTLAATPLAAQDGPWRAQDGGNLPFANAAEAIDFLATAEVVERKEIGGSYNKPLRVTLEKDGVRARAIFRTVDTKGMSLNQAADPRMMLRDNYKFEVAAWELARHLGLDSVPPATLRTLDGKEGSIQLWIEGAESEQERLDEGREPANSTLFALQRQELLVFDALILNYDRNPGNQLVDQNGKLWWVDHTRTFMRMPALANVETLRYCPRRLWDGLHRLDLASLEVALEPYLEKAQIKALLKRHRILLQRLEEQLAERGESDFLYDIPRLG